MEKYFQICYNKVDYHLKEGFSLIPMDCHTHTEISPDSDAPVREMLQSARNQGISVYAVTDHIELCRYYSQCFYGAYPRNEEDFFNYAERWERAMTQNQVMKHTTSQDMIFVSGIELGEPDADFPLAESLFQDVRLDFVIASLHELLTNWISIFWTMQRKILTACWKRIFRNSSKLQSGGILTYWVILPILCGISRGMQEFR